MVTVGFGGGCHWCTEAVFSALAGVDAVHQGFIRSDPPHDSYSEAVEVTFDPANISLEALIRVHLATHASTSNHSMRGKYRSAIYTADDATHVATQAALAKAGTETGARFVTAVLPHRGFKPSDARFKNYYVNDPSRPFCKTYVDPKLAKLKRDFIELLKSPEDAT